MDTTPDPTDMNAVNLWLRELAIKTVAEQSAQGKLTPAQYDYFRRGLQSLQAEWREMNPGDDEADPLAEVQRALSAVG